MENIGWGLQMTVLGMGLVFALLALLWGLLNLILVLDKEAQPAQEISPQDATTSAEEIATVAGEQLGAPPPGPPAMNGMPADLVAAIMTAATLHHKHLWRQAAPHMRTNWPGSQLFASRWMAAGRVRQNSNWQPRG